MSHGGGNDSAEADLTPLLDLVLQLLMFFIVNVNFVTEQVSPDIKLPSSESARPIDKADTGALFINQKAKTRDFMNRLPPRDQERLTRAESIVLIPGQPPMMPTEANAWLKDKYEQLRKTSPNGEVTTVINFRPDGDLEYKELMRMMNFCKAIGFRKFKVRALVRKSGG